MTDLAGEAHEAVARSADVRASLRREFPEDRDERLSAALNDLSAAMEPIKARLLQAPSVHRLEFEPELREASKALQVERRKVRAMLTGKQGGRPDPSVPRVPEKYTLRSFDQSMNRLARDVKFFENETDDLASVSRRRLDLDKALELREDARDLADEADLLRLKIRDRIGRAWAYSEHKRPGRPYPGLLKINLKAHALLERIANLIRRLRRMGRNVRRYNPRAKVATTPVKPTTPRRKWRRWTEPEARDALDAWAAQHGRRPRARDLTDPDLPGLGTVQRLLGGVQ